MRQWPAKAEAPVRLQLTEEEKAWLAEHPVIRVSNERDWPPINFIDNGIATGFSVEYLKLVAEKVVVELELVPGY